MVTKYQVVTENSYSLISVLFSLMLIRCSITFSKIVRIISHEHTAEQKSIVSTIFFIFSLLFASWIYILSFCAHYLLFSGFIDTLSVKFVYLLLIVSMILIAYKSTLKGEGIFEGLLVSYSITFFQLYLNIKGQLSPLEELQYSSGFFSPLFSHFMHTQQDQYVFSYFDVMQTFLFFTITASIIPLVKNGFNEESFSFQILSANSGEGLKALYDLFVSNQRDDESVDDRGLFHLVRSILWILHVAMVSYIGLLCCSGSVNIIMGWSKSTPFFVFPLLFGYYWFN
eukprot:TRINITY_DN3588_c0_g1_i2.p1 TRINITY_DN3588_c0_g1~~TRINITY_DN3588_c0_g1_i2.p1  ORF type:complete len:284 (+),score=0.75 TRINITY_DN3588_c0_g1_i2:240-1091(+)